MDTIAFGPGRRRSPPSARSPRAGRLRPWTAPLACLGAVSSVGIPYLACPDYRGLVSIAHSLVARGALLGLVALAAVALLCGVDQADLGRAVAWCLAGLGVLSAVVGLWALLSSRVIDPDVELARRPWAVMWLADGAAAWCWAAWFAQWAGSMPEASVLAMLAALCLGAASNVARDRAAPDRTGLFMRPRVLPVRRGLDGSEVNPYEYVTPGWYADPDDPSGRRPRYWDGYRWDDVTTDA